MQIVQDFLHLQDDVNPFNKRRSGHSYTSNQTITYPIFGLDMSEPKAATKPLARKQSNLLKLLSK